jgi:hypothetical protein
LQATTDFIINSFTLALVSTLLISSFATQISTLSVTSELSELKSVLNYVATEGNHLLALVTATNSTANLALHLPPTVGNKDYWIRLDNNSVNAWVEGGLGSSAVEAQYRVFFFTQIYANGKVQGGFVLTVLSCFMNGTTVQLQLSLQRE